MAQETTDSAAVPREMTVAGWLFNPFIRVAGGQALAVGLTVIVTSGLAAAAGGLALRWIARRPRRRHQVAAVGSGR